jgi:hypothetical protein
VFVCHSYLLEACGEASWSEDKMNDYCYPSDAIELWQHNWNDDFSESSGGTPAHVHCDRGIWTVDYSSQSRSGLFTLLERSSASTLYQRNFEIT